MLTITLTGGTEVSGKVTEGTELECESATPPTGGGDDQGDGDGGAASCTAAALVPGAVVREAELRVSSARAVWVKVELFV